MIVAKPLVTYFIKKFLSFLLSLWCVATGTFLLMHAVPGDPFIGDRFIPEEVMRSLYSFYGLDQPLAVQYLKYLKELLCGQLGHSIVYHGRSVNQFIAEGLPVSATLGIQALCLAIPLGVVLGVWAALHRSRWPDNLATALSTLLVSVPNFVLSSLLQYFFSVKLHWLPVARWGTFTHTILPTLALAALPTAFIARLIRSNMVEIMQQEYIRTAAARGLAPFRIAIRHGLRNALLPVLSYLGPVTASILTGSFMVEKIFAIPGLGQWTIQSINNRDYPMIIGLTIFYSAFLIFMMFLSDLLYFWLDPRIRKPCSEEP